VHVWAALAAALFLGAISLVLGTWALRRVGLVWVDQDPVLSFSLGLGTGLLLFAISWAALFSKGRSYYLPAAAAALIALAVGSPKHGALPRIPWREWARIGVACGLLVAGSGLLATTTVAPSPRDGVWPMAYEDPGFWSTLASGLSRTGTERLTYPTGLDQIPGVPTQDWYHWGDFWVASAASHLPGVPPIEARYMVFLPLAFVISVMLCGCLTARLAGSRGAFVFGAAGMAFLGRIPLPHGSIAAGPISFSIPENLPPMLVEISVFGLATLASLLAVGLVLEFGKSERSAGGTLMLGALITTVLPSHFVIAALALAGVAAVFVVGAARASWSERKMPSVQPPWRGLALVVAGLAVATVAWAFITGHGFQENTAPVTPFALGWAWSAVVVPGLTAGVILMVPLAWLLTRRTKGPGPRLLLGTMFAAVAGLLGWGIRYGALQTDYLLMVPFIFFLPAVTGYATWVIFDRLRARGRASLSFVVVALFAVQTIAGLAVGLAQLRGYREDGYTYPAATVSFIQGLPPEAKLGYGCVHEPNTLEPELVGLDAITGRRLVPLCYFSLDPRFRLAPQSELYTSPGVTPSRQSTLDFLRQNDIGYLFADADHPNTVLPELQPISAAGGVQVFRVP